MEKEFVPYEIAVKMKELGFEQLCFSTYVDESKALAPFNVYGLFTGHTLAPLWQQSFDWFREKHNKHAIIYKIEISEGVYNWDWDIVVGNDEDEMEFDLPLCETYYEARLACLEKLIELTTQH